MYPEKGYNLLTQWATFIEKVKGKIHLHDTSKITELYSYINEQSTDGKTLLLFYKKKMN